MELAGLVDVGENIGALNYKAEQGWELVSVVVNPVPRDKRTVYLAFFKRPLINKGNIGKPQPL